VSRTSNERPQVLLICGHRNHTLMMHAIARALPDCACWFTPYYCDDGCALRFELVPTLPRRAANARPARSAMTATSLSRSELAMRVREHVIRMTRGGGCFLGASLSCADLRVHLYTRVLQVSPETADDPERDYLLLSKGHDVPSSRCSSSATISTSTGSIAGSTKARGCGGCTRPTTRRARSTGSPGRGRTRSRS
jgi:hypothetical protein